MEEKHELQFEPLSRNIYDRMNEIVNQLIKDYPDAINVNIKIPDGFVKLPNDVKDCKAKTQVTTADILGSVLSGMLTGAITGIASVLGAPVAIVVLLSAAGGATSTFIQDVYIAKQMPQGESSMNKIDLAELRAEDIAAHLDIDLIKEKEIIDEATSKIINLCKEISDYEAKNQSIHDIAVDKQFGEWIQQFIMYTASHAEDIQLQNIKYGLINCLANMKIQIFDETVLKEEGEAVLPVSDYVFDGRSPESIGEVRIPAVYSDKMLLAKGEIV